MNISFNSCFNYTVQIFKENLLLSLTDQQKKTAIIATAIFGSLLTCCWITYSYFKNDDDQSDDLDYDSLQILRKQTRQSYEGRLQRYLDKHDMVELKTLREELGIERNQAVIAVILKTLFAATMAILGLDTTTSIVKYSLIGTSIVLAGTAVLDISNIYRFQRRFLEVLDQSYLASKN